MSDDLSIPNSGYRGSRAGRYGTGQSRVRQGMDPDTRRLMMFAGSLGAILVVLIGASSLMSRRSGEVPVVTADSRPIREKPVNPGGMKIDGAENDVFSGGSDTSNARLAPVSESPNTKALRSPPAASPMEAETPAAAVAAPTPAPVVPPAAVVPSVPVAKPAVVANTPSAPAKPAIVANAPPKPASAKPPVAAAEARPVAPGHQPLVQFAALPSEDAAHAEWAQLAKKMPDLLNGKQPNFSRIDRDGRTFWRLRTSGFADAAQARVFCERVRAKGAACSVADF